MVRVTVLYGHPADSERFDAYFKETHVQLAIKAPGVDRIESALVKTTGDGGRAPYHRISEVYFENDQDFHAFLDSSEGKLALGDLDNFAPGIYQILISEVDSVTTKEPAATRW